MTRHWLLRLLLAYISISVALACSCVDGSWNRPKDESITDDFKSSTDVYTATVAAADCKCFPTEGDTARLDCQSYVLNDNDVVVESVGKRYECTSGDQFNIYTYSLCGSEKTTLVSSLSVDYLPDLPPITTVTGEENCGISGYDGEGCQLSHQPCFYNVTVVTVYKGTLAAGDVVSTAGPDVLTSCGDYGRVLTLGVEYVVGIGGACNPINEWTPLETYSETDVALLEDLQQMCAEDPSTCNSAMGSHLLHILLLPLVILTTLLIY